MGGPPAAYPAAHRDERHGDAPACCGDSFTPGYDVERDERFTERLAAMLPQWEAFNLGVSGYGTAEALLLLRDTIDGIGPDAVLLDFTHTDVEDNASSVRDGGYPEPWFEAADGGLVLRSVPVPGAENHRFARSSLLQSSDLARAVVRTGLRAAAPGPVRASEPHERTFAILDAMHDEAEARGAVFVVGRESRDGRVAEHLDRAGIVHVDRSDVEHDPGHGEQWTPAGHAEVAERLRRVLGCLGVSGTATR